MSSEIDFLDKLSTHIRGGAKGSVKARVQRQKRQRQQITETARAFERAERAERGENSYESPPPELPNESANIGSNINNGLPGSRSPPPSNSEDNGNNGNNEDNGLGGPGSSSSFSGFQGNSSTNSVRLSLEEIEKLKAAIRAEEEAKAKAKAKEESAFMQEIGNFIELGNRGTARSGQRNSARGRTEFEEFKESSSLLGS